MSATLAYGTPLKIQEVKASGDTWEVAGLVSTFGNVDLGGDVVHRGAFADSLKSGAPVRFLYSHDPASVLGTAAELRETDAGLYGRFKISRTRLGQDVHTLLHDRAIDSFSIGYLPKTFDFDDDGVRHLKSIDLLECSLVSMPMNPQAVVTGVKSVDYSTMRLDAIVQTLGEHRAAALAAAKALARRRAAEGRKLSDRVLELLEALRAASLADADDLLALLTAPPPEREEKAQEGPDQDQGPAPADQAPPPTTAPPAAVGTAGSLVEAHLRRARLKELRRKFADVALPEADPVAHLARLEPYGTAPAAP